MSTRNNLGKSFTTARNRGAVSYLTLSPRKQKELMHRFSGSLQYYLVIIVLEIVIVCLFQDGNANVSPNHAYLPTISPHLN